MKIKKLNIKEYKHLENINFDFTYPEGHEKAGESLEKICIIGQSATGKTNILELLKHHISGLNLIEITSGTDLFSFYDFNFDGYIEYEYINESMIVSKNKVIVNKNQYERKDVTVVSTIEKLIYDGLKLLYFTSEIISKEITTIFSQNPLNILNSLSEQPEKRVLDSENYIYEFSQNIDEGIWFSLLSKILDYRKKFTQKAAELINKGAIGDLNKLNKEFVKWSETNKNPLVEFAELFDPILNKLNLQVDTVNTEYAIPIKSKINDDVIPFSGLSTGTKGLLFSLFPLFELDTADAIILVDEPERSLFPDMQIELIDRYRAIAPDSQLIVATHSPFIAAAFEPEERFILYFNEKGKVAVRRGESPIGDDPNDILRNDFNVDYYNEFGKNAYKRYTELKRDAAQETEPTKKKKLIVEAAKLGDKYNF